MATNRAYSNLIEAASTMDEVKAILAKADANGSTHQRVFARRAAEEAKARFLRARWAAIREQERSMQWWRAA